MKIRTIRRIVQAATIAFLFLIPALNRNGITFITGTLYSLAIGPVWLTDPFSGFQILLTTLTADGTLLVSMLIPIVLALALGRVFCGWICPQNTVSEFFDHLSRKWGIKALFRPAPSPRPRYIILAILITAVPLIGFPVANLLSAPGIVSVQITKYISEEMVGVEMGLIGVIILLELFVVRRGWCKYVCPVGGFLGLFRFKRTMKVVFAENERHVCGQCMECVQACQLGLDPMKGKIYPLCHNCGDCIAACSEVDAKKRPLSFRF